ncbi:hypothetical protein DUNSADRAFT_14816 [Dunaliella salina]|uniref:Uncharacterized protein n=1 Tax=Dunaliella salina TaxID=3046 RepID=A0ABQ7G6N8_DUNSA|nr:hypothetical protein DUNSADRAFT_14816 [Dunaliella salina]|eukprot:KAF5830259.1 hypothetical protein DUNSADRAFT_14816 [Dunaliella salina]
MQCLKLPSTSCVHNSRLIGANHLKSVPLRQLAPRGGCSLCLQAVNGSGGGQGFGGATEKKSEGTNPSSAPPSSSSTDAVEALEARIRSRRARKGSQDGPKVQVNAPAVDATRGDAPLSPEAKAETNLVAGMLFLFYTIIIEGLVIAGSGFLPEDWEDFISNSLYPNYTPTVLLFLGLSSAYGLWKTGKLSLPFLGRPPPQNEEQK